MITHKISLFLPKCMGHVGLQYFNQILRRTPEEAYACSEEAG